MRGRLGKPFRIDTLMNRIEPLCTASANAAVSSDEAMMPDDADMMKAM